MNLFYKKCIWIFGLGLGLLANAEDTHPEEETKRYAQELVEHSPFIPDYYKQSGHSTVPVSTLTTANYQFHSVVKMADGSYQFGLTDTQSSKGLWISSTRENNDPALNIQFYTYDENKHILVIELPEGLVRVPLVVHKESANKSQGGYVGVDVLEDEDDD